MSELCSPVKFGPSIKKKARQSLNWQNCVICQEPDTNEDLINMQSGQTFVFKGNGDPER